MIQEEGTKGTKGINPREIDFAEKTESKEEKSTTPQI